VEAGSERKTELTVTPFPLGETIGSRGELEQWFHRLCVRKDELLIGIEVERLGVSRDDGGAIPYYGENGLEKILRGFEESFGWRATREDGHIIHLTDGGCGLNLEPGGQFEISGSPEKDLHAVLREQDALSRSMQELSADRGIVWMGYGMQPFSRVERIDWMPKVRYRIMKDYLPRAGKLGHLMMKQTASVQVSIDYLSEEDALFKMRLATALSPIATAMFANSPISEGGLNGYLSKRAHIWNNTDPSRCGLVMQVLKEGSGFSDYVDYALSVPMLFIRRNGEWIDIDPIPFSEFLEHGCGGHRATFGDWDLHLTTLFPEVRMKGIVEIRSADGQRPDMIMTVPAFWKGLMYDPDAGEAVWDLVRNLSREDLLRLSAEVPVKALGASVEGRSLNDLASELLALSREGLRRQGAGEEVFLEPIEEMILEERITPAEDLIRRWEAGWKNDPMELIEFHRF